MNCYYVVKLPTITAGSQYRHRLKYPYWARRVSVAIKDVDGTSFQTVAFYTEISHFRPDRGIPVLNLGSGATLAGTADLSPGKEGFLHIIANATTDHINVELHITFYGELE